jgi:hypothetical protein
MLSAVGEMIKEVKLPFMIGEEGAVDEFVDIEYLLFVSPVYTALSTISKYEATCSMEVAGLNSFN